MALHTYTLHVTFKTAVDANLIAAQADIRSWIAHTPNNLDILTGSITRDDGPVINLLSSDPSPAPQDAPIPTDPAHPPEWSVPTNNEF
jgi:hypothetical protein